MWALAIILVGWHRKKQVGLEAYEYDAVKDSTQLQDGDRHFDMHGNACINATVHKDVIAPLLLSEVTPKMQQVSSGWRAPLASHICNCSSLWRRRIH